MIVGAVHLDGLLLGLAGLIGLHLAGDNLGLGHIVAAAVLHHQDQIALSQVGLGHDVLVINRLVVVEGIDGGGLLGIVLGDNLGQGLLQVEHIVHDTVLIVIDHSQLDTVAVGLILHVVQMGIVLAEVHGSGSIVNTGNLAVVDVVLGTVALAQAGALQEVLQGILGVHAGDDGVSAILQIHTQHLGVGQHGGVAHVHSHGLAQQVNGSGHVEGGVGTGLAVIHAGAGVDGVGVHQADVAQTGLASSQSLVGVGAVQVGPLVTHNHALQAVHTVLGGQDGAVVIIGDGIAVLVALDHLDVQGVVHQQGRVVAGQGGAGGGVQVVEDAQGGGQSGSADGPVVAGQALDAGVVAGGHQQHLGGLGAGDGGAGVEGAVAAAGDDAQAVAVVDVALSPVALHVGQAGVHPGVQAVHVGALVQDGGDHLRHLGTGHIARGIKVGAVFLTLDHAKDREQRNGVLVDDFVLIGEVVEAPGSAGPDNHHADQHGGSQKQAESPFEVSHLDFLLLKFELPGAFRHELTSSAKYDDTCMGLEVRKSCGMWSFLA